MHNILLADSNELQKGRLLKKNVQVEVRYFLKILKSHKCRRVRKKGPVLLSTNQAQPGRAFSQLGTLSFA